MTAPNRKRAARKATAPSLKHLDIVGRERDRDLIQSFALSLSLARAHGTATGDRASTRRGRVPPGPSGAEILRAFRESPLVGSGVVFKRERLRTTRA